MCDSELLVRLIFIISGSKSHMLNTGVLKKLKIMQNKSYSNSHANIPIFCLYFYSVAQDYLHALIFNSVHHLSELLISMPPCWQSQSAPIISMQIDLDGSHFPAKYSTSSHFRLHCFDCSHYTHIMGKIKLECQTFWESQENISPLVPHFKSRC